MSQNSGKHYYYHRYRDLDQSIETIAIAAQTTDTATTVHILEILIVRGRHHLVEATTTVHALRSLDIAITRGRHYLAHTVKLTAWPHHAVTSMSARSHHRPRDIRSLARATGVHSSMNPLRIIPSLCLSQYPGSLTNPQ